MIINSHKLIAKIIADNQYKLEKLQQLNPYLIDASLRETSVGSPVGQTLNQKIAVFSKLRNFGFNNIIVGALNYSMPEHLQVDDHFMMYLRNNKIDMTNCFCFTDVGTLDNGVFIPSPSQLKMKQYEVPCTMHEVYLSSFNTDKTIDEIIMNIKASVQWLKNNINQKDSKIIINIVDGCDAFAEKVEEVCQLLEQLSLLDIYGVSIEDDRGSFLEFQITNFIKIAKIILPEHMQLLVHLHNCSGVENSAILEALLAGATGVWGALPKSGGVSGHASLGELISNLVRIGNVHMNQYQYSQLLPLIDQINHLSSLTKEDNSILSKYSYTLNLSYFKQKKERFMDLHPEIIGGEYTYRICPVMSDIDIIHSRLKNVLEENNVNIDKNVLEKMIQIMRFELNNGNLIEYNLSSNLIKLYNQAKESIND